jgi:LacI family transcriptional regulator
MPREEAAHVTLKQVAAAAGVSLATTSYALRNDPRILRKTTARVQAAARRLGYRPNPRVSALMAHIRRAQPVTVGERIAFLWLDVAPGVRPYQRMFDAARKRATQLGYALEEFWLDTPGLSARRLEQIIYNRGIAGMLISPRHSPDPVFRINWNWNLFSPVILGTAEGVPELHHSAHHHYGGMRLAMMQLAAGGKRRIAGTLDPGVEDRVRRVWSAAFLVHHPLGERAWEFLAQVDVARAAHFAAWLRRLRPEAVVAPSWVFRNLVQAGWKRPAKCTVVFLDWAPNHWGYGGIDQGEGSIASNAVDMVAGQLQRNERGAPENVKVLLSVGKWVEGK